MPNKTVLSESILTTLEALTPKQLSAVCSEAIAKHGNFIIPEDINEGKLCDVLNTLSKTIAKHGNYIIPEDINEDNVHAALAEFLVSVSDMKNKQSYKVPVPNTEKWVTWANTTIKDSSVTTLDLSELDENKKKEIENIVERKFKDFEQCSSSLRDAGLWPAFGAAIKGSGVTTLDLSESGINKTKEIENTVKRNQNAPREINDFEQCSPSFFNNPVEKKDQNDDVSTKLHIQLN